MFSFSFPHEAAWTQFCAKNAMVKCTRERRDRAFIANGLFIEAWQ